MGDPRRTAQRPPQIRFQGYTHPFPTLGARSFGYRPQASPQRRCSPRRSALCPESCAAFTLSKRTTLERRHRTALFQKAHRASMDCCGNFAECAARPSFPFAQDVSARRPPPPLARRGSNEFLYDSGKYYNRPMPHSYLFRYRAEHQFRSHKRTRSLQGRMCIMDRTANRSSRACVRDARPQSGFAHHVACLDRRSS